jgi:hypothetical protein
MAKRPPTAIEMGATERGLFFMVAAQFGRVAMAAQMA